MVGWQWEGMMDSHGRLNTITLDKIENTSFLQPTYSIQVTHMEFIIPLLFFIAIWKWIFCLNFALRISKMENIEFLLENESLYI